MPNHIRHFVAKQASSLRDVLQQHLKLDSDKSNFLIEWGAIYCNKKRVLSNITLKPGDYLRIHLNPKRYTVPELNWSGLVTRQTKDFMVVHKPAGLPTHATLDNQVENLLHQMRQHVRKDLWVTQRLDTDTEGLLVLAKNKRAQAQFNKWLQTGKVTKRYHAMTTAAPPLGLLTHYMEPSPRSPKRVEADSRPNWLKCDLVIESVEKMEEHNQVRIRLLTGRTHQIRAQLAAVGCPIVGDSLYKGQRHPTLGLKCVELVFPQD